MNFTVILAATCVFVLVAANSIKAVPWLWYGLACAVDIVYAYGIVYSLPPMVLRILSVTVQRCLLATALFAVVMYCGVFSEQSAVRRRIGPIRAELSIMACILAFAHCLNYLESYLGVLSRNVAVVSANQLASLILAIVLFALMVILGVTSFKKVKHRMKANVWKAIQRSAYVFFALIYVHELLVLYPSATKGAGDAMATCVAGGIVFALYFVLRFVRYVVDRKRAKVSLCSPEDERGASHAQTSL